MTDTPPGLHVGVELSASIAGLHKEMGRLRRINRRRELAATPQNRREILAGQPNNQYPTSGNLVLSLDGPQLGRIWEVRHIVIGGAAITATPAGTAYVFKGAAAPGDLSTSQIQDWTSGTLPQQAWYSTGQLKLIRQENLYVVITNGTAGTTYVAYADIEEYPDTRQMATADVE